ncbi:MAG: hypothetical protein ACK40N_10875 [Meiothermus ruber]|jgi:hypothetical protein|uniref:Uncharacterized protein n=1 Tax=Meiothermus ruber TaxID=277 RepID=A0A7C3HU10_MEIRU|nr:MAG: hypothetical protein KatS3mg071_0733 [Meiothermus sp.]
MEKPPGTKLINEGPSLLRKTRWYRTRRLRLVRVARARYLRRLRETPPWQWPALFWQYRRELRAALGRITPSAGSLWLLDPLKAQ